MPLLIIKAIFSRLLSAGRSAFGFARANPHLAIIIALVGICGLLWWSRGNIKDERDEARTEIVAMKAAMNKAVAASKRLEQASKELANAVDDEHARSVANAMDATTRYISANRVRETCAVRASAPAEGDGSGLPVEVPGDAVMVAEADVRICTARSVDILKAHEWAVAHQDLQDNGPPGIY